MIPLLKEITRDPLWSWHLAASKSEKWPRLDAFETLSFLAKRFAILKAEFENSCKTPSLQASQFDDVNLHLRDQVQVVSLPHKSHGYDYNKLIDMVDK